MAMTASRTCSLRARLSTSALLYSGPAYTIAAQNWRVVARTYATESAVTSKRRGGAPSAKATHNATRTSSASPKRTSTKVEERAAGHAGPNSAVADVKALAGTSNKSSKTTAIQSKDATAQARSKSQSLATKVKNLSEQEQQLKELEAIEYFKRVMRSADPFGQPIADSLALNADSMLYLASDDSIPGVNLGRVPWYKSIGWLFRAAKSMSVKDGTWVAPLRQIALQSYREINQSVANRDTKAIKDLAAARYQGELLRRIKKQPSNIMFKWNLEREVSPTQIVSLRATQYFMGKQDPKFGNRYLIHALIKFDTEQSLEFYGPNGEALHEAVDNAEKRPDGTIPAKPKRVTEYLVIEKRGWYDTPWVFREQKWAVPQRKV